MRIGELVIWVEIGGVRCGGQSIGTMHKGSAEGNRRGVSDADVEPLWRGQDAVLRRGVGDCVPDDLADLDGADLMEEQHRGRILPGTRGKRSEVSELGARAFRKRKVLLKSDGQHLHRLAILGRFARGSVRFVG